MDSFWLALGLKACATALVVVVASVVAERAGPRWGGLVASIPVSAGPAYVLLAMQHDVGFIANSALSSFAGGMATWVFLTAFVRLADRRGIVLSLGGALFVWLIAALVVRAVPWTLLTAGLANLAAFGVASRWGQPNDMGISGGSTVGRAWFELPLRAVMVGLFVALVVSVSDAIGPSATGIAAVFPIALSSLSILMNRRFGISGAAAALGGAIKPLIGIACGFVVLSLSPEIIGTWPALGAALIASLIWPTAIIARHKA